MSWARIPVESLFSGGFRSEEKSSPEIDNGDEDKKIFFR
jgi:hypothetical protein